MQRRLVEWKCRDILCLAVCKFSGYSATFEQQLPVREQLELQCIMTGDEDYHTLLLQLAQQAVCAQAGFLVHVRHRLIQQQCERGAQPCPRQGNALDLPT